MSEFLSIVYLSGRLLDEHDYSEEKSFQNMGYMLIKLSDVPATEPGPAMPQPKRMRAKREKAHNI